MLPTSVMATNRQFRLLEVGNVHKNTASSFEQALVSAAEEVGIELQVDSLIIGRNPTSHDKAIQQFKAMLDAAKYDAIVARPSGGLRYWFPDTYFNDCIAYARDKQPQARLYIQTMWPARLWQDVDAACAITTDYAHKLRSDLVDDEVISSEDLVQIIPTAAAFAQLSDQIDAGHVTGIHDARRFLQEPRTTTVPVIYLDAMVTFGALFKQSPVGLKTTIEDVPLTPDVQDVIQTLAWGQTVQSGAASISDAVLPTIVQVEGSSDSCWRIDLQWTPSGGQENIMMYRITQGDGTLFHTIAASLTDTSVYGSRRYQYTVSAVGYDGRIGLSSSPVYVATKDDSVPPTLELARAHEVPTSIHLVFSEPVDPVDARNLDSYTISDGIHVVGVEAIDQRQFVLKTTPMTPGRTYTLALDSMGFHDRSGRRNRYDKSKTVRFTYTQSEWRVGDFDHFKDTTVDVNWPRVTMSGGGATHLKPLHYSCYYKDHEGGDFDVRVKMLDQKGEPGTIISGIIIANDVSNPGQQGLAILQRRYHEDYVIDTSPVDIQKLTSRAIYLAGMCDASKELPVWLRIKRVGKQFDFYISVRGTAERDWMWLASRNLQDSNDRCQIGLLHADGKTRVRYPTVMEYCVEFPVDNDP